MTETIKQKQSNATLTIKLSSDEITRLKNEAIRAGFDTNWQDYARRCFREEVTGGLIGSPTIGSFKKITAPSKYHGN